MNLGLVTSYIIAGLLLFAIAMMNIRVQSSGAELTITQIINNRSAAITDMLNDDIPNMGFNLTEKTDQILTIGEENKIQFYRNIDSNPQGAAHLITWELTDEEVASTGNPNDFVLTRTIVDTLNSTVDVQEIRSGVTKFELQYFKRAGDREENRMPVPLPPSELNEVEQIRIIMELQSEERVSPGPNAAPRYIRTLFDKRYSPGNLN